MARCKYYFESVKSRDDFHRNNEDYLLHSRFTIMNDISLDVMVLADGIGGLDSGEVASRSACISFMEAFYREMMSLYIPQRKNYTLSHYCGEIRQAMTRAFSDANKSVLNHMKTGLRIGTTLSAAVLAGDYLIAGNVGDSPIYFYDKEANRMDQIAVLQTQAEEDMMEGRYERYSEEYFENDYLLTHYMGQYEHLPEDIIQYHIREKVHPGDQILMVSDGAVGQMRPEKVYEILQKNDEETALAVLFAEALKDKDDDQTAIWVKIQ